MVCVNCISPGYFMGLCFMVLFSLCLPFWVKAPNPACFQGADLISCLLSEYAYQKKKKKSIAQWISRVWSSHLVSRMQPGWSPQGDWATVNGYDLKDCRIWNSDTLPRISGMVDFTGMVHQQIYHFPFLACRTLFALLSRISMKSSRSSLKVKKDQKACITK